MITVSGIVALASVILTLYFRAKVSSIIDARAAELYGVKSGTLNPIRAMTSMSTSKVSKPESSIPPAVKLGDTKPLSSSPAGSGRRWTPL